MKQYLDDEKVRQREWERGVKFVLNMLQVEEIDEIIEMKITHRRNLERRKLKFG